MAYPEGQAEGDGGWTEPGPVIGRFPGRHEYAWATRPAFGILIALVLVGGIFPALYGDQVPHDHLFVGGAPPVGWENHVHPNPLFALLGGPTAGSVDRSARPAAARTDQPKAVRVISVYDGMVVVLSIVATTVAVPTLDRPPLPSPGPEVVFIPSTPRSPVARGPAPPPPRDVPTLVR